MVTNRKEFNLYETPSVKMELAPNKSRPTCYAIGGNYKNWGDGIINDADSHKYDYKKITKCIVTVYGLTNLPEDFCYRSFANTIIKSVYLSTDIKTIYSRAFYNCTALEDIYFNGTIDEWDKILKIADWHTNVPAKIVHCIDGDVNIK